MNWAGIHLSHHWIYCLHPKFALAPAGCQMKKHAPLQKEAAEQQGSSEIIYANSLSPKQHGMGTNTLLGSCSQLDFGLSGWLTFPPEWGVLLQSPYE